MEFKSGFITVIGRPNVGKSTLVNSLSGNRISITSSKPQTTRNSIRSIATTEKYQMVFIDTPGIHKPKTKLGEFMVNSAIDTLNGVDLILFVVEAIKAGPGSGELKIIEQLKQVDTPVVLVINKVDLVGKESILPLIQLYSEIYGFDAFIPVSAKKNDGLGALNLEILKYLTCGPKYYPEDVISDQPERFIVTEIIREKLLHLLNDEVPHGTGVEIITFNERKDKGIIDIDANIYCEKESHKGIIIGKKGSKLKKAGQLARQDIEILLGARVFLQLWVKTKQAWRDNNMVLKDLGYK